MCVLHLIQSAMQGSLRQAVRKHSRRGSSSTLHATYRPTGPQSGARRQHRGGRAPAAPIPHLRHTFAPSPGVISLAGRAKGARNWQPCSAPASTAPSGACASRCQRHAPQLRPGERRLTRSARLHSETTCRLALGRIKLSKNKRNMQVGSSLALGATGRCAPLARCRRDRAAAGCCCAARHPACHLPPGCSPGPGIAGWRSPWGPAGLPPAQPNSS